MVYPLFGLGTLKETVVSRPHVDKLALEVHWEPQSMFLGV